MAIASMSFIGGSTLTGYLLVIAKKTSTPLVTEDSISFPPPVAEPLNLVFPTLDPVPHIIEFRDSPDGSALGTLITTFLYDVKNQVVVGEMLFYQVGGMGPNDPPINQPDLTDPYLDGKTIGGVFREGYRYLKPVDEWVPKTGGGVSLVGGLTFSEHEVIIVQINYLTDVASANSGPDNPDYKLITADTTLDITYRNTEIELLGDSTRLVVTLEPISSMPDGTRFHFSTYGGTQLQAVIKTQLGALVFFNNSDSTSIVMGKNEYLTLVKRGTKFKVLESAPGLSMVGEKLTATSLIHPNTLPEDGRPLDGDDYPRLWGWLSQQPTANKITTDDASFNALVHPVGKEGQFIVSTTSGSKKFKMPNTQGWGERGLKSFTVYGTDVKRSYDYPGGTEPGRVGKHFHRSNTEGTPDTSFKRGGAHPDRNWNTGNTDKGGQNSSTDNNKLMNADGTESAIDADENIMKNNGVIYLRRT